MWILPQFFFFKLFFKVEAGKALPQKVPWGPPSPQPGPETTSGFLSPRSSRDCTWTACGRSQTALLVRVGGSRGSAASFNIEDHPVEFYYHSLFNMAGSLEYSQGSITNSEEELLSFLNSFLKM